MILNIIRMWSYLDNVVKLKNLIKTLETWKTNLIIIEHKESLFRRVLMKRRAIVKWIIVWQRWSYFAHNWNSLVKFLHNIASLSVAFSFNALGYRFHSLFQNAVVFTFSIFFFFFVKCLNRRAFWCPPTTAADLFFSTMEPASSNSLFLASSVNVNSKLVKSKNFCSVWFHWMLKNLINHIQNYG